MPMQMSWLLTFLGDQVGELENRSTTIVRGISNRKVKMSLVGPTPNLNTDEDGEGDSAIEAYRRYAAVVNRNRESFCTRDRHWDFGIGERFRSMCRWIWGWCVCAFTLDLGFWLGFKK